MDHSVPPPNLLNAISDPAGGKVTLVLGAGCSFEAPTNVPLSRDVAQSAYDRLVNDGVFSADALAEGDQTDLIKIVRVLKKLGRDQGDLVERFPLVMRTATPNKGYRLAAALLYEQAIKAVITLNYDTALATSLSHIGAQGVGLLLGPEDHRYFSAVNAIYLHRYILGQEPLILDSAQLDKEWKDKWEEVVARSVMTAPWTVFIGLGSPAPVLTHSVGRVRQGTTTQVVLVDPAASSTSGFGQHLCLEESSLVRLGWGDFMEQLAERHVAEQRQLLAESCRDLVETNGWEDEDIAGLCGRVADLGLERIGNLRAHVFMILDNYVSSRGSDSRHIADLILAVGLIERRLDAHAEFTEVGTVEFFREGEFQSSYFVLSGRGFVRSGTLPSHLTSRLSDWHGVHRPTGAIVAGIAGLRPSEIPVPRDVIRETDTESVVRRDHQVDVIHVDDIRSDPSRMRWKAKT